MRSQTANLRADTQSPVSEISSPSSTVRTRMFRRSYNAARPRKTVPARGPPQTIIAPALPFADKGRDQLVTRKTRSREKQ